MASPQHSRRFYIDQEADHAVVRTVPVRRTDPQPIEPVQPESPATHQLTPDLPSTHHPHFPRIPSRRVSELFRSARKRSHHSSS